MSAKFIIEQIVMSMSFLKADMFPEHNFIKQENEHGMYKYLKAVINHPETSYLQGSLSAAGITFDEIKKFGKGVNYSYVLDILSEINRHEQRDEVEEVLENYLNYMITIEQLPKIELFIPVVSSLRALNWNNSYNVLMSYSNSLNLDKSTFDKHIECALWNGSKQVELIFYHFKLPKSCLVQGELISDSDERRKYFIKSLRDFLFNVNHDNEKPKGDSVSDDTQAVQEILNKPIKDKDMKQEQFYTKLYFYSDAKRIVFSGGQIEDIAECFSKLSVVDQADVCNQFGITITSIKHVPGIATVLATMFMNMDMQMLKRKLSDLVSHGFINEFNDRLDNCKTWEDANNLHKYAMVTFNGMKIPDLKDIIVKYMALDNHDQFEHDGTQLAGFFSGVIYADAMTMVKRYEEQLHGGCRNQGENNSIKMSYPLDFGVISDDVGELYIPDIYDRNFGAGLIKGKQETQHPKSEQTPDITMSDVLKLWRALSPLSDKENEPKQPVKDQVIIQRPRIIIIKR